MRVYIKFHFTHIKKASANVYDLFITFQKGYHMSFAAHMFSFKKYNS